MQDALHRGVLDFVMHDVKSRLRFDRDSINYLADLLSHDLARNNAFRYALLESMGPYHSTKNSGANIRKFTWANGTVLLPVWKTVIVRLEFFNDFQV